MIQDAIEHQEKNLQLLCFEFWEILAASRSKSALKLLLVPNAKWMKNQAEWHYGKFEEIRSSSKHIQYWAHILQNGKLCNFNCWPESNRSQDEKIKANKEFSITLIPNPKFETKDFIYIPTCIHSSLTFSSYQNSLFLSFLFNHPRITLLVDLSLIPNSSHKDLFSLHKPTDLKVRGGSLHCTFSVFLHLFLLWRILSLGLFLFFFSFYFNFAS